MTAISTASFCMSGSISALLMMIFLVGTGACAGEGEGDGVGADGFRSSELGLAIRAPPMFFFVSSPLIFLSSQLTDQPLSVSVSMVSVYEVVLFCFVLGSWLRF